MAPQGSNDLNLLLKARVVKIKVELDIKGSGLIGQVNNITKFLKDKRVKLKVELETTGLASEVQKINNNLKSKKVKLGVELSYNAKDINKQINAIASTIKNSKTGLSDLKIGVSIDVKGTASKIKAQLADINKVVQEFNTNYAKQIKQMQEQTQKMQNQSQKASSTGSSSIPIMGDMTAYAKSVKDAQQYMKSAFGKGFFSSSEIKDANGVLTGFIGTLTKANGVVQKIRYDWDANSGKFSPINRQTITNTEKSVADALKSLRELDREISKLGKNQGKFWDESNALKMQGAHGTLNQQAVDALKTRIKDEQTLQAQIKAENTLLRQQKELLAEIQRESKKTTSKSYKGDLGNLKNMVTSINLDDSMAKNQLSNLRSNLNGLKQDYANAVKKEKDLTNAVEKRKEILAEIARIEKSNSLNSTSGSASKRYIEETRVLAKNIKTMEDYNRVKARMNSTNRDLASLKIDQSAEKELEKLRKAMHDFSMATGRSASVIQARFDQVAHAVKGNVGRISDEIFRYNKMANNFKLNQAYQQKMQSIVPNADHTKVKQLISAKDNQALKEYIANLNGAQVAMMRLTTDSKGISRITAQFASTKKTAKEVVYEFDNVDKKLRQLSTAEVFNANRNLGIFEQLKIAMARVPVWTVAMTAFYGSMRTVRNMTEEIFKLDKAMTELRRVADSQIDTEFMFQGAVKLSKELGNNIHDVMASVNDLARTFGHFNERQLLAITNTATLMSNVSDLNAQEATESLVGTMNAFNITAEDSIRIVDSMNEVDNNYAISTKQLATGLAKSASTAKTFGVEMEENIGHITAIGAVTMESGNIIGNSLKTIYSRITTMGNARDVLADVGVSITDMSGDTREVGDIIEDLGGKWNTLSKSQQQNIAVTVAGRYQLSRFLALMNNFEMAQESINTAYNSQGSAMRENARYLESFEARINSLKTSFTEMADTIGDAFLTGGLSVGIDLLTSLADVAVSVVDKIGILPIVLVGVGTALLAFKTLGKTHAGLVASITAVQLAYKTSTYRINETTVATNRLGAVSRTVFASIRAGAVGASTAIRTMGTAMSTAIGGFKGALASTGILAGFLLIGIAIEKLISHFDKLRMEQEEYENTTKKMINSFRASSDGMQGMIDDYDRLSTKKEDNKKLTEEESQLLDELTRKFAEQLPTTVDYFDSNGNAILKNTEAIREQIKAVADLSREQAKLKNMQLTENIEKEAKSYMDIVADIEEQKKKIKNMPDVVEERDRDGTLLNKTDNTIEIQKETVKLMELESQRREGMSSLTKLIQEQTIAYFEANGMMEGFGDNQQKLIERFSSYNDELLRTAETEEEVAQASEDLISKGKLLGTIFTDAYSIMSENLSADELEEYRTQLEAVSASVPEEMLTLDSTNSTEAWNKMTEGVKEFINVSGHVKAGSEDYTYLAGRLQAVGYSSEESRSMLSNLAGEYSNVAIKSEALRQSTGLLTEGIDDLTEASIEATSPIENLFGITADDTNAIKSHLETLELLHDIKDKSTTQNMNYLNSLDAVAEYFRVAPSEIEANVHEYTLLADALSKVKTVMDEQGGTYLDLSAETSGLTDKQRELLGVWLEAGGNTDIFTGELLDAKNGLDEVAGSYDKTTELMKEPFPTLNTTDLDAQLKNSFANQLGYARDARAELDVNASVINRTLADLNTSTQNVASINDNLSGVAEETKALKDETIDMSKQSATSFTSMKDSSKTNTTLINTYFDSVVNKFKLTATEANNANTAISNMNGNAKTSLDTIATWQTRLKNLTSGSGNLLNSYNPIPQSLVTGESFDTQSITSQAIASYSATAEGVANSIGSGGDGTSGVIQPSTPMFNALHGTSGASKYNWRNSSSSSSTASKAKTATTKATKNTKTATTTEKVEKTAKELAELYVIDLLERKRTQYQGTLSQIEAKISSLSANTHKYRVAMLEAQKLEGVILDINKQDLIQTEKRNKEIEKRLSLLSNTSKHTEKQREEYNKLQQEYDSNLGKISQLKGEIESTIVELRKKTEEIFNDFIDDIVGTMDKALKAITDRIDDVDFELEVLELTDPENVVARIDLMARKVRDLTKQQREYTLAMEDLEERLRYATSKFGIDSDAVKNLVEQMEQYKESWEDVRLEILRTESEIKEMRLEVADKMIESTKKLHENAQKNAEKTADIEIDNAKKAHEAKMKMYDEESERISDIYDKRIKALDDSYNEETYQADVTEKSNEISKLQQKVVTYSGDTSLEGKKRLAESQKELEEKQKELNDFMKKHHLDALKEQLQEEKDLQLDKISTQKEIDEEAHNAYVEQLEAEKEAISAHYESVIEDEKKWSRIREELMKGNFTVVNELLQEMGINLEQMSDGTFNTLSEGFSSYSQEVRDFVFEINDMINQINSMTRTAHGSITVPSNPTVSIGEPVSPVSVSSLIQKAYSGEELKKPTEDKQQLYDMIKNSGINERRMNEIWRKAQSGISLDIPSPEHTTFYNMFEDILKTNKLKKFDTGGYTGDNVPKSGGLAILDNKELVLNEKQTSHILNAVKLLDKVKSLIPEVVRNNVAGQFGATGTFNNNTSYNLTVNIDSLNGDKSGATTVVKEIMKNLRKMGK